MHGAINTFRLNNFRINGPEGSILKSLQSGIVTTLTSSVTVNINEINTDNAIVFSSSNAGTSDDTLDSCFSTSITSDSITFTRSSLPTFTASITFQVAEFNNVKSKQVITGINLNAGTANVTINAVDITKTILFLDFMTTASITSYNEITEPTFYLTTSTNLLINFSLTATSRIGVAQILELN
jgi:hypothetical protein